MIEDLLNIHHQKINIVTHIVDSTVSMSPYVSRLISQKSFVQKISKCVTVMCVIFLFEFFLQLMKLHFKIADWKSF